MKKTIFPGVRAAAIGLLALAAEPSMAIAYGSWQVLETQPEGTEAIDCVIRTRAAGSEQLDSPPHLYLSIGEHPELAPFIRLDTGGPRLDRGRLSEAAIQFDDKPPRPARASLRSATEAALTSTVRDLKLGGVIAVEVVLADGRKARYRFSLIGFTNAFKHLGRCAAGTIVPAASAETAEPAPEAEAGEPTDGE